MNLITTDEFILARRRNRRRLEREKLRRDPPRWIDLTRPEAASFAISGRLIVRRKIHPKHFPLRNWQCPYGRPGMFLWIHEPVKWWGKDEESAAFLYAESPDWPSVDESRNWLYCDSPAMPLNARRFRAMIFSVQRSPDARSWEITIERLPDEPENR